MIEEYYWCVGTWCIRRFNCQGAAERAVDYETRKDGHITYFHDGIRYKVMPCEINIVNDEELKDIQENVS